MLTNAGRDAALGSAALGAYIGLIKSLTNWRTPTVVESDYTGYGTRPGVTWGAAADTTPVGGRQRANTGAVTFPQNTGGDSAVIGWGVYAAATTGTPTAIGLLDTDPPIFGICNVDDTITAYAHGLVADQRVFVLAAPGAALPAIMAEGTAYYVLAAGLTADVFKLSLTSGGAAIDIAAGAAGLFCPYKSVTVAANATPEFAVGALIVQI